jgi:two-component system LytT family sensor kinase
MRAAPSTDARPPFLAHSRFVWGAWAVWGLFVANQIFLIYTTQGITVEHPWAPFVTALVPAGYWALATGPITTLAWRWPLRRDSLLVAVPVHLAAALVAAAGDVGIDFSVVILLRERLPAVPVMTSILRQLHTNVLLYAAVVAIYDLQRYQRLSREREVRTVQLETQLVKAQLNVLKMQIQPHFLFNTLNAISQLFHEDPDAAERMMARLGDLLRITLEQGGDQEVVLARELDILGRYIDIQKARFEDRLDIEVDVPPELLDAHVPNLLLQPLVENAIKHGIARMDGRGFVRITARQDRDRLIFEVRDNGPGLPPTVTKNVGLTNTEERIRQLYGTGGVALVAAYPGTIARVDIPLRTHNSAREVSA